MIKVKNNTFLNDTLFWMFLKLLRFTLRFVDDFTVNVRLPFEKAHDMKWVSSFMYLEPENKAVEVRSATAI